jgi:hypothetical protein
MRIVEMQAQLMPLPAHRPMLLLPFLADISELPQLHSSFADYFADVTFGMHDYFGVCSETLYLYTPTLKLSNKGKEWR